MHQKSQEELASTPKRIFPLSPEMVRRLRIVATSDLHKVRKSTMDQKQAA